MSDHIFAKEYDRLFDPITDDEERYYKEMIPKIPPEDMRSILREMIDVINSLPLTVTEWVKFKLAMLVAEKTLNVGQDIFVWSTPPKTPNRPYISFDVNWSVLKTSKDYYVVWMTIEGNNLLPEFEGYKNPYDIVKSYSNYVEGMSE